MRRPQVNKQASLVHPDLTRRTAVYVLEAPAQHVGARAQDTLRVPVLAANERRVNVMSCRSDIRCTSPGPEPQRWNDS